MFNYKSRLSKNISEHSMFRYNYRNYLDLLNYKSRLSKNIPDHSMSIVDQCSYGKYICSITILGCWKIYLGIPCPSYVHVVTENIYVSIVDQGSYGKYIWESHVHSMSGWLRKINLLNYNSMLPEYICSVHRRPM